MAEMASRGPQPGMAANGPIAVILPLEPETVTAVWSYPKGSCHLHHNDQPGVLGEFGSLAPQKSVF